MIPIRIVYSYSHLVKVTGKFKNNKKTNDRTAVDNGRQLLKLATTTSTEDFN